MEQWGSMCETLWNNGGVGGGSEQGWRRGSAKVNDGCGFGGESVRRGEDGDCRKVEDDFPWRGLSSASWGWAVGRTTARLRVARGRYRRSHY